MDIDPDVAALLDDLPPVTLPSSLADEGWGQQSLEDVVKYHPNKMVKPSTSFQPSYNENCVQCGRPITLDRGYYWMDHSGKKFCVNVMLDEVLSDYHIIEADVEILKQKPRADLLLKEWEAWKKERLRQEYPMGAGPCGVGRMGAGHVHVCGWPTGHFGFHECSDPTCRRLWT